MALLTWNDELAIGVSEFDAQHRQLVALINQLHDALAAGEGHDALGRILSELVTCTVRHFSAEESVLLAHGYPELRRQADEHEAFTRRVRELLADWRVGKLGGSLQLTQFPKEWITNHIQVSDRAYASFLRARGIN